MACIFIKQSGKGLMIVKKTYIKAKRDRKRNMVQTCDVFFSDICKNIFIINNMTGFTFYSHFKLPVIHKCTSKKYKYLDNGFHDFFIKNIGLTYNI